MNSLPDVLSEESDETLQEDVNQRIIQEMQERTKRAKKVYGAPTLQLSEGMMSIFIRPDASQQVIHFKNLFSSSRVGSLAGQEGIMDLGSLRSTIIMTDPNRESLYFQQENKSADFTGMKTSKKSLTDKNRTLSSDINSDPIL